MLQDTDRLLGTVEQVLKASEVRQRSTRKNWTEVDLQNWLARAWKSRAHDTG